MHAALTFLRNVELVEVDILKTSLVCALLLHLRPRQSSWQWVGGEKQKKYNGRLGIEDSPETGKRNRAAQMGVELVKIPPGARGFQQHATGQT